MKFLFLILLLSVASQSWAVCRRAVDPKKVVLFIDTNDGAREITTARDAACARGEKFVVVPESGKCEGSCLDKVSTALQTMKESGAKPVSLMISGHDGGGAFSGETGSISRTDLAALFQEEFPEFKDSVKSLFLLGCYTGVKFELFAWMNALPQLQMIAGYEGAAPLSDKRAGHSYIRGLMLQENSLLNQTSAARLRAQISAIPDISVLNDGLMVRAPQCVDPATQQPIDFYHRSNPETGGRFEVLNSADCRDKVAKLTEMGGQFAEYFDGMRPIPEDTRNGELRRIYNFYRSSEHCYENRADVPRGDQVLGMLFYPGFSENIARYLEPEANELSRQIQAMTLDDWKRAVEADRLDMKTKADMYAARVARLEANPAVAFAQMKAEAKAVKDKIDALMHSPFGLRLGDFFNHNPAAQVEDIPSPPFERAKVVELISLFRQSGEWSLEQDDNDIENFKSAQTMYRDAYQARVAQLAQFSPTAEALAEWKSNVWLPTRENIVGKSRTQHRRGLHALYTLADSSIGVPQELRQRLRAFMKNSDKLLGNLKCLPLSWHESLPANAALEQPTCQMVTPERTSGAITQMNGNYQLPYFGSPEN